MHDTDIWEEVHSGEEDASEGFYRFFATGYYHFLASVVFFLEIVLFEPHPVGSAAGSVVLSGVARSLFEVFDYLFCGRTTNCWLKSFLMPRQSKGRLWSGLRKTFIGSEINLLAFGSFFCIGNSEFIPSLDFYSCRAGHRKIFG